ncbi:hypothetical protein H4V99_000473 [Cryobacterium sp. CG_9.6]|nr:hypothetical protein [Cryobacterium sp. CG_9.6]
MAQNPKQSNKVARAARSGMSNARFSAAAETTATSARAQRRKKPATSILAPRRSPDSAPQG